MGKEFTPEEQLVGVELRLTNLMDRPCRIGGRTKGVLRGFAIESRAEAKVLVEWWTKGSTRHQGWFPIDEVWFPESD